MTDPDTPPDPPVPTESEQPARSDDDAGGSGTAGRDTPEKRQAGSYARDAEQDPERDRHGRDDAG